MKKLYLIRHGQTNANIEQIHIPPSEAVLTNEGLEQAKKLGKYLAKIPSDIILCSPYIRAIQTCNPIEQHQKNPKVQECDLLHELVQPSDNFGHGYNDDYSTQIRLNAQKEFHNPDYRYKDMENFGDIKKRADLLVDLLDSMEEETIFCVGHEGFFRILMGRLILGEDFDSRTCYRFMKGVSMGNTSISYFEQEIDGRWRLKQWSITPHLD